MTVESVRIGEPLSGDYDAETCAREIPESFVLKGMFFSRLAERAEAWWPEIEGSLQRPPRRGRYVAFSNYPQADYERLSAFVAKKLHPKWGLREAVRRLARDDFDVFAASTFGRVVLAMVGDARSALHKVPYVYEKVAPGHQSIRAEDVDGATVRLEFAPNYGSWEYQVGQLEGIVLAFGGRPAIRVELLPERVVRFDVRYA